MHATWPAWSGKPCSQEDVLCPTLPDGTTPFVPESAVAGVSNRTTMPSRGGLRPVAINTATGSSARGGAGKRSTASPTAGVIGSLATRPEEETAMKPSKSNASHTAEPPPAPVQKQKLTARKIRELSRKRNGHDKPHRRNR